MRQGKPADLMRGEETRVAGVLAARPGFDGVLCLPGAHTKWVHVSAGEIVSFTTFMTGELFALLTRPSALRHGLGTEGWDEAVFLEAVADAMGRPQGIGAALFGVDAACVLGQTSPETARARLSGLLVGLELAGARPHWLGQEVRIVGTGDLARAYGVALRAQAASVGPLEDDDFALRGLCAARGGAPFTTGGSPAT
jgi:2-dehydro-3-deoxygalactonokinase